MAKTAGNGALASTERVISFLEGELKISVRLERRPFEPVQPMRFLVNEVEEHFPLIGKSLAGCAARRVGSCGKVFVDESGVLRVGKKGLDFLASVHFQILEEWRLTCLRAFLSNCSALGSIAKVIFRLIRTSVSDAMAASGRESGVLLTRVAMAQLQTSLVAISETFFPAREAFISRWFCQRQSEESFEDVLKEELDHNAPICLSASEQSFSSVL